MADINELDFSFAQPTGNPYGNFGKPVRLFEGYREWSKTPQASELEEAAHTTSDFATYLSAVIRKRFYDVYRAAASDWRRYSSTHNMTDFRPENLVGLTEFSDLLEVMEEEDYKYGTVGQMTGPQLELRTYGRLLQISRKAMINDDLGKLAMLPDAMARAAARTLQNKVLSMLTTAQTAYDGNPFFDAGTHGNAGTGALAEATLQTAILALLGQTNQNGDPLAISESDMELVVPIGLKFTAARIVNSAVVEQSAAGTGTINVLQQAVRVHTERLLTDQTDWYLHSRIEGSDAAPVNTAFLNGQQEPAMFQKTTMQQLGGGAYDPYNLEVDSIDWKIRHDWGVVPGEYRLIYKATVAG
jgi:phage major head subunit gpT-like protein